MRANRRTFLAGVSAAALGVSAKTARAAPVLRIATPMAALRSVRKRAHDGAMIVVSAADPLNLLGGIVAGDKVPRQPGARLLWRDGLPLASFVAGEFKPLPGLAASEEHAVRMALLRDPAAQPGPLQAAGSRPQADPLGLHR